MSVNMQRCFFISSFSFTTCFGLMQPSSGVQPLMEPAALLFRFCIQFWFLGHVALPHDGTSTYKAEPRGPKTRIECKVGITVQQVPSRDEHLKMAT
jgi:hypothetical protein